MHPRGAVAAALVVWSFILTRSALAARAAPCSLDIREWRAIQALKAALSVPIGRTDRTSADNICNVETNVIECTLCGTDGYRHVSKIEMMNSNISGTLPSAIGDLVYLHELDLSHNDISGTLPAEMGRMSRLAVIRLGYNYFEGAFELSGSLPSLRVFEASYNYFEGDIADILERTPAAESIIADHNLISGSFSSDRARAAMRKMRGLRKLELGNNMIEGTLPLALTGLSLEQLRLENNMLSGTLPESQFGSGTDSLRALCLRGNRIEGYLSATIGRAKWLEELDLSMNLISGAIPDTLLSPSRSGGRTQLQAIKLAGNRFSAAPAEWLATEGDCDVLGELDLGGNPQLNLTLSNGALVPCRNIRSLSLRSTGLCGRFPQGLVLPEALEMDLRDNRLVGNLPSTFEKHAKLKYLYLNNNFLEGSMPNLQLSAETLIIYSLHSNLFTGPVPRMLFNMPSVRQILLHNNQLSGEFPLGGVLTMSKRVIAEDGDMGLGSVKAQVTLHQNLLSGRLPDRVFELPEAALFTEEHNADVEPANPNDYRSYKFKMCGVANDFYEVILGRVGWELIEKGDDWDAAYGDCVRYASGDNGQHLGRAWDSSQVVNIQTIAEYPDMFEVLGDKINFGHASSRRASRNPTKDHGVQPQTFSLAAGDSEWRRAHDELTREAGIGDVYWLLKPANECCGRGIQLVTGPDDPSIRNRYSSSGGKAGERYAVQRFIHPPATVGGHKVVFRLFVTVTSFSPLRAYVHRDGPAFFTGYPYNATRYLELQRASVTQRASDTSDDIKGEGAEGSKSTGSSSRDSMDSFSKRWIITDYFFSEKQDEFGIRVSKVLPQILIERGVPPGELSAAVERVWDDIEVVMAKTLLVAVPEMRRQELNYVAHGGSVYETVGFDVLLDSDLRPWVCEVNGGPNMGLEVSKGSSRDTELRDTKLKFEIMGAALSLAGVHPRFPGVPVPLPLNYSSAAGRLEGGWIPECLAFSSQLIEALIFGGFVHQANPGVACPARLAVRGPVCLTERDMASIMNFECEAERAITYGLGHLSRLYPRRDPKRDVDRGLGEFLPIDRANEVLAWWVHVRDDAGLPEYDVLTYKEMEWLHPVTAAEWDAYEQMLEDEEHEQEAVDEIVAELEPEVALEVAFAVANASKGRVDGGSHAKHIEL